MTSLQFERLTDNIRNDGGLTSLPLVYDVQGDDKGKLLVLSGNHRVDAAEAAGLTEIQIIEVTTRIPEERRKAIALSHNAIAGQDDPNLLHQFYDGLSLALKQYSGLTEDSFKAAKLDVAALTLRAPQFEQLVLQFLPEAKEIFLDALKRLGNPKRAPHVVVGRFEDFDAFFDTMMRVKKRENVHNAATALKAMADLATQRLDQLEAADAAQSQTEDAEAA